MITPEQAFEKYWEQRGVDFHGIPIAKDAFLAGIQYQELNQIGVLADIRKAVGDGEGKLMGDELVKRIEGLVKQVSDLQCSLLPYQLVAAGLSSAASVVTEDPWQPIESAPKDSRVLVFNAKWRNQEHCGYWSADFREWRGHGAFYPQPTHWMPLPAGPVKSVTTEKEEA